MFRFVSLHRNQKYENDLLDLLNDEWPQSKTIRLRRFERSCDELPTVYLLLDQSERLIGSCYVDRFLTDEKSVIVESVCIQRSLRGKGFGKILMKMFEEKIREDFKDIHRIYLTTTDKQEFYSRCGFEETNSRVRLNVSKKFFEANSEAMKNLLAQQSTITTTSNQNSILQKDSIVQRIPTIWMKKEIQLNQ